MTIVLFLPAASSLGYSKNSIASGIPAKPIGRFDVFMALRRMGSAQTMKFKNQELPMNLLRTSGVVLQST